MITAEILEQIAERIHDKWANNRRNEGWSFGPERNDERKETPCLVPYNQLPEIEKEYDRATARETLSCLDELGYDVIKRK